MSRDANPVTRESGPSELPTAALASAVEEPLEVVALVAALLQRLDERDLPYCLWKSTARIDEVLSGRTDFDILVDESVRAEWEALISEIGFKPFISHQSRRYPGIEDRIGYDEGSGRLVHLHVHYQLILGQQYVKNHRLPIESALLSTTTRAHGVRIPLPEVELAILTLRALLKYRDVDAAKDLLRLGHRGGMPPDIVREVHDLAGRIETGRLATTLAQIAPMVPASLVEEFTDLILHDRRDAARLLRLRHRARDVMRPYQRMSSRRASRRYLRARLLRQWPISLVSKSSSRRQARRKSPAGGGSTIAVIGADGSGKTTLVDDTASWLSGRIRIKTFYLGSARPSGATNLARLASKAMRRVEGGTRRALGPGHRLTLGCGDVADTLGAIRAVGDARDRRTRFRAGVTAARGGTVVIFDRFPIRGVSLGQRHVDGPRIEGGSRFLLRRLAQKERLLHRDVGRPDHIIALEVSPDVAVKRKQPRDEEALRAKCRAITEWEPDPGWDVIEIDADMPLADVRLSARHAVWRWL